jgi:hypothetical protein
MRLMQEKTFFNKIVNFDIKNIYKIVQLYYSSSIGNKKSIIFSVFPVLQINQPLANRRYDIQHNDTQHNDIQHNDTRHNGLICYAQQI